jgi:hypothetical protein
MELKNVNSNGDNVAASILNKFSFPNRSKFLTTPLLPTPLRPTCAHTVARMRPNPTHARLPMRLSIRARLPSPSCPPTSIHAILDTCVPFLDPCVPSSIRAHPSWIRVCHVAVIVFGIIIIVVSNPVYLDS